MRDMLTSKKRILVLHTHLSVGVLAKSRISSLWPSSWHATHVVDEVIFESLVSDTDAATAKARLVDHVCQAQARGYDAFFCTCSSMSQWLDELKQSFNIPLCCIDDAAIDALTIDSINTDKIALIATVETAVASMSSRLRKAMAASGKTVAIEEVLIRTNLSGDREVYLSTISNTISALKNRVDRIVLVQASMSGAKSAVDRDIYEVLESGVSGVVRAVSAASNRKSFALSACLFGANGKMGRRIGQRLSSCFSRLVVVPHSARSHDELVKENLLPSAEMADRQTALLSSDVIVLAIPDNEIQGVIQEVSALHKSRPPLIVCLDAVAFAGGVPESVPLVVIHPCHPPAASLDWRFQSTLQDNFGGLVPQNVVWCAANCTLQQEQLGEQLAAKLFSPVVQRMKIPVATLIKFEPMLIESVGINAMRLINKSIKELSFSAADEEAARLFVLGHLKTILGIEFAATDIAYSNGCVRSIRFGEAYFEKLPLTELLANTKALAECVLARNESV